MAAPKSTNTRLPPVPGGASKCFRYIHARSQADGSQSCQDSGVTVCGKVTAAKPLSSKPGRSLSAEAGPNSQPVLNETVLTAGPLEAGDYLRERGQVAIGADQVGQAETVASGAQVITDLGGAADEHRRHVPHGLHVSYPPMMARDSSSRLIRCPGGSNGMPAASYSGWYHPAPRPSSKRPPDRWCRLAASWATIAGCRKSLHSTIVPTSSRSVTAAAAARALKGASCWPNAPAEKWSRISSADTPSPSTWRA